MAIVSQSPVRRFGGRPWAGFVLICPSDSANLIRHSNDICVMTAETVNNVHFFPGYGGISSSVVGGRRLSTSGRRSGGPAGGAGYSMASVSRWAMRPSARPSVTFWPAASRT